MATPNWMKQLEKQIESKITSALQTEVSNTVKKVMSETIEDKTYNQYLPTEYERRGDNDGLSDIRNMEMTPIGKDTISIRNVTTGNKLYAPPNSEGWDSGYIDEYIVSGSGYNWTESEIYNADPPIKRDFYEDTREELRNTNEHIYAMYKGLQRQGVKVEK